MSDILIYETNDRQVEVRLERETVWLTQQQMADLFGKDVRTISEHIQTIFRTGELTREATLRKFRRVRQEGKRQVRREIDHYNLDMVISVGYRVNSIQGTRFRIWATRRLRDYQPLENYHAKHSVGWNCPARWKSLLSIGSSPQPEYRYNEKAGNP